MIVCGPLFEDPACARCSSAKLLEGKFSARGANRLLVSAGGIF